MGKTPRDTYKYVFKEGNKIKHGGITNQGYLYWEILHSSRNSVSSFTICLRIKSGSTGPQVLR